MCVGVCSDHHVFVVVDDCLVLSWVTSNFVFVTMSGAGYTFVSFAKKFAV